MEVTDGDTISLLDSNNTLHKIRLAGIDAPETGQDFSNKSKLILSSIVFSKSVEVVGDKIDKYGRRVGKIIVDGIDANLRLVADGLAWHYKEYQNEQSLEDRNAYAAAEITARDNKKGLWSAPNPIAPWDWRHGTTNDPELKDKIFGNTRSLVYHWAGCPGFLRIAAKNRVVFDTWQEAEEAGYKAANGCSTPKPDGDSLSEHDAEEDTDTTESYLKRLEVSTTASQVFEPSATIPVEQPIDRLPATPNTPTYGYTGRTDNRRLTGACQDGTLSYSVVKTEACIGHGGVAVWIGERPTQSSDSVPPSYPPLPTNSYSVPSYPPLPSSSSRRPSYPAYPVSPSSGDVYVNGYFRRDGTYVGGHHRTAPNRTTVDNFSTRGNVNPYTGRRGSKRP